MRIKIDGESIYIITRDGKSFDLQKSHFKELYDAFNILKDLFECESLDSIDYDSFEARKIYELTDLCIEERKKP